MADKAPPFTTLGARRYFWARPTSSEKSNTPAGMVHLLEVTKLFDQMALFSTLNMPNHTAAKMIATNATTTTTQTLGGAFWGSTRSGTSSFDADCDGCPPGFVAVWPICSLLDTQW